jgi:hypothetical protein
MADAYFLFTNKSSLLGPNHIPALAAEVLTKGSAGAEALNDKANDDQVSVPERRFLAVLGTTGELEEFFERLRILGVGEIGCWRCLGTRVKVNHPDHNLPKSTITLLIFINNEANIRHDPLPGWTRLVDSGPVTLDTKFDLAIKGAKDIPPVN